MKNKWDTELSFRKWNIHAHIFRIRGLDNVQSAKLDNIFYLSFGWSKFVSDFRNGFYFRIGFLDFDADEDKSLFGFTIPIGKPHLRKHDS